MNEIILRFIKSIFVTFLSVGRPLNTQNVKFIPLHNQECKARMMLIDLYPHELR